MMQKADFMGNNKEVRMKDLSRTARNNATDAFILTLLNKVKGMLFFLSLFFSLSSDVSSLKQLSVVSTSQILIKKSKRRPSKRKLRIKLQSGLNPPAKT